MGRAMADIISRKYAKSAGIKRYYTGKPCNYGHVCERMVSTRACVDCLSNRSKEWKAANPERCSKTSMAWRKANPEKVKENKKRSNAANPESQKIRSRRWYEANKQKSFDAHYKWAKQNSDKLSASAARYRSKKLNATVAWADHDAISAFYREARNLTEMTGEPYHVDHIIPLQGENVSGLHVETNLQILHGSENQRKGNRA